MTDEITNKLDSLTEDLVRYCPPQWVGKYILSDKNKWRKHIKEVINEVSVEILESTTKINRDLQ